MRFYKEPGLSSLHQVNGTYLSGSPDSVRVTQYECYGTEKINQINTDYKLKDNKCISKETSNHINSLVYEGDKIVLIKVINKKTRHESIIEYFYGNRGELIKEEHYCFRSGSKKDIQETIYEYQMHSESGIQRRKMKILGTERRLFEETEYDDKGRVIGGRCYNGSIIYRSYTIEFLEEDYIKETHLLRPVQKKPVDRIIYYRDLQELRISCINKDVLKNVKLDVHNNLVLYGFSEFKYEYDNNNNWVKKYLETGNDKRLEYSRTILY